MIKQAAHSPRFALIVTYFVLCSFGCDSSGVSKHIPSDAGSDGFGTAEDAGGSDDDTSTTEGDTDPADSDSGKPEPGGLGEACWIEILKKWHPNYGLGDCRTGLHCIGDSDEAWCTKKCTLIGEYNTTDVDIEHWCCGALADPCDPQKYWLPLSMSFSCIPRTALLAESCDLDSEWSGAGRRCAPICDGTSLIRETQCAQHDDGTFCTFQCDPVDGDATCLLEPAFEGGCCGDIMAGSWCLIPSLCN